MEQGWVSGLGLHVDTTLLYIFLVRLEIQMSKKNHLIPRYFQYFQVLYISCMLGYLDHVMATVKHNRQRSENITSFSAQWKKSLANY